MSRPKMGELCAGYGGLGMGVAAVTGAELAWVSEIDTGANKILAHRFPEVPNIGDLTTVDWSTVEPVDILTAGFPCQPVSQAGKRLGDNDERWLWDDVARAVGELRPDLVVLENVRGLLTAGGGRLFGRVLGALADLGYDAQWQGLRAADVGAPHGRWRVFIVAHLAADADGVGSPAERIHAGQPNQPELAHPGAVSRRLGAGADRQASGAAPERLRVLPGGGADESPVRADRLGRGQLNSLIKGRGPRLLPTPTSRDWKDGAQVDAVETNGLLGRTVWPRTDWGIYAAAIARWEVLTRPSPAPTQPSKTGAPRLSPAFSEWLMGLPEGHVTEVPGLTRNEKLKAIGNGVCPQQCAAAVRFLLNVSEAAA